ncbi:MAG: hypothetical protein AAF566_06935 [Pseudomonadota bacterium]
MRIKSVLGAAAAIAMLAMPASALVVQHKSAVMTEPGQDFYFDFKGLAPSDDDGARIVIYSGPATTGSPADAGFDLDGAGAGGDKEFFKVVAGGTNLGRYTCGGPVGKTISHQSMNGQADCEFKLVINLDGDEFNNLLDGDHLPLWVKMARGVGSFGDGDQLNVKLKYNEVIPAPLPATGLLLLGGLAAVGAAARRRKAQA